MYGLGVFWVTKPYFTRFVRSFGVIYARPGGLLGQKVVIWVIWTYIRTAWGSFWSKSCDLGHLDCHLNLYTYGLGASWVKKLDYIRFGWSFGVIYVRSGGLFRQKDVFWMIGVVIWSDICTAWASF